MSSSRHDGPSYDVSVLTSGHDVADARLHRLVAALHRRGLTVEVLGLGSVADGPAAATVTTSERRGLRARGTLAATLGFRARGRVLLALDPDSLVAARTAGALRHRPVVADVHEDYARLLDDRAWARGVRRTAASAVVSAAVRAAAGADLTLVADDHVPPLTARNRLVVRNEPDLLLLGEPREPDPAPRAVYVGDVRGSRGLFTMLNAVAAAPIWSLDIIGPVARADQGALDALLDGDARLANRVRCHGRRPPRQAWQIARGAWVGFGLLADTPAFRDAVPSKLYEYCASGIVPVVSPLPRQAALVAEAGGVVAGSVAEVTAALIGYAEDVPAFLADRASVLAWAERRAAAGSPYDVAADRIAALLR